MSFDARQNSIGKLLNDAVYHIPRNQRLYVWTERNWSDLFRDLELVSEASLGGGEVTQHFLGSIVLKEEESEPGLNVFTVIDGQQRIITLTILLAAIIFVLKRVGMADDAVGTVKYVIAKDIKGVEHEIVDPEQHLALPRLVSGVVGATFEQVNGVSPKAFSKGCCIERRDESVGEAFVYFCSRLNVLGSNQIVALRDALISAQYVNISSSTEEDLYTIFEILNARGLPLADGDLLKNYIMRYIQPKARRDEAKAVWSSIEGTVGGYMKTFLRHYAIQCCRLSSGEKGGVYSKIRDFTDPKRANELLSDLHLKARYYDRIVNPTSLDAEGRVLCFFKTHNVQVFRPLIMSLMHLLDVESISRDEYDESLDFIYRFYVCYKVIGGLESNQLTDTIGKHAYALERTYRDVETLKAWKESFLEKLPAKETFVKRLSALGWSHVHMPYKGNKNKDQCKVVLELLERERCEDVTLGDYTIEHILPDSASEDNAQIGNLVMLEERLNTLCGNGSFESKLPILAESRFATTRGFVSRYTDKSFDPASRTDYLAKHIYELLVPDA